MKRILLIPCLALLATACNNPGDKINNTSNAGDSLTVAAPVTSDSSSIAGCYAFEGGKDTVMLQLEGKSGNVTGPLSYNYFEKDRNDGTLQGTVSGDLLSGFYLFKSEGVMSVRQEAWMIRGDLLVPGNGEMIQRNDSMIFKDPATLKFDESRALKKRPCTI